MKWVLFVAVLFSSPACRQKPAETAHVFPTVHDVFFLRPGNADEFTVTVDLDKAPPSIGPVDVVFLFDSTGSMAKTFETVRTKAIDIVGALQSVSTNVGCAVATFSDYGAGSPWILHQQLTTDQSAVRTALERIQLRSDFQTDEPEAYSRALHEARFLQWRPGASRYIVLFGDAPPHDPNFFGENLGVDPGRDEISGTADDLHFASVVEALRDDQIRVLAILDEGKAGGWFSRRSSRYANEAMVGFEYAASKTGGIVRPVAAATDIPNAIALALRDRLRVEPHLAAAEQWRPWTEISRPRQRADGKQFDFDVTLTAPEGTDNGIHRFPLVATNGLGGGEIGYVGVTVRLGLASYEWRPVLVVLYLVVVTLAAWVRGRRNRGRVLPHYGHQPLLRLVGRAVMMSAILAGLYGILNFAPGTLPAFSREPVSRSAEVQR